MVLAAGGRGRAERSRCVTQDVLRGGSVEPYLRRRLDEGVWV